MSANESEDWDATQDEAEQALLLQTVKLTKQFGSFTAVNEVELDIAEGEVHSVIGPNGAGKTTLFNLITGALPPTSGGIVFDGIDVTGESMDARARLGLSRSFQIAQVFPGLSIRENLLISYQAVNQNLNPLGQRPSKAFDVVDVVWDRLEINAGLETTAEELSHGDKKKLEIGMSLVTDPHLLLLDEPTAGMSEEDSHRIVDFLRDTADEHTLLVIEHDVDLVLQISDRITVLQQGSVIASGSPSEIIGNDAVQDAYLGGS